MSRQKAAGSDPTAEVSAGLKLFDEAMLIATHGTGSELVRGLVYCSVVDGCQKVFAIDRAREWTSVLAESGKGDKGGNGTFWFYAISRMSPFNPFIHCGLYFFKHSQIGFKLLLKVLRHLSCFVTGDQ